MAGRAFPRLFEPGMIGNVQLKNRIMKAPQHTGLANPDGSVTDRMLRYYRDVAMGGVGMVIVEYAWIDNDASKASPCQLGISEWSTSPGSRCSRRRFRPTAPRRPCRSRTRAGRSSRWTGPSRRLRPCRGKRSTWQVPGAGRAHLRRDPGDRQVLRGSPRNGRRPRISTWWSSMRATATSSRTSSPPGPTSGRTGTGAAWRTACASCWR